FLVCSLIAAATVLSVQRFGPDAYISHVWSGTSMKGGDLTRRSNRTATVVTPPVHANTTVAPSTATTSTPAPSRTQLPSNPTGRKLLCHKFTGRLGNELFQYASILGLALAMNRTAVFIRSQSLEKVFKTSTKHPTRQAELEDRCSKAHGANEGKCCRFNEKLTRLDPEFDFSVGFYLQSYRYWIQHEDEVKRSIVFSDAVHRKVNVIVNDIRRVYRRSKLIGVHVRRGDYTYKEKIDIGYRTASPEFINKSLTFFRRLFPTAVFVVASDGIDWCKKNFPSGFHVHYLDMHEAEVDLLVLASTDHIVITSGSYSWWAGYLNKGITVIMKDFIVPGTPIGDGFNPDGSDFIYPTWIPL
ncbi:hypothetical protein BaRGS_00004865, partial [Batillaria attramentaria]